MKLGIKNKIRKLPTELERVIWEYYYSFVLISLKEKFRNKKKHSKPSYNILFSYSY